jgi:hypothetical protein
VGTLQIPTQPDPKYPAGWGGFYPINPTQHVTGSGWVISGWVVGSGWVVRTLAQLRGVLTMHSFLSNTCGVWTLKIHKIKIVGARMRISYNARVFESTFNASCCTASCRVRIVKKSQVSPRPLGSCILAPWQFLARDRCGLG